MHIFQICAARLHNILKYAISPLQLTPNPPSFSYPLPFCHIWNSIIPCQVQVTTETPNDTQSFHCEINHFHPLNPPTTDGSYQMYLRQLLEIMICTKCFHALALSIVSRPLSNSQNNAALSSNSHITSSSCHLNSRGPQQIYNALSIHVLQVSMPN